MDPKQTRLVDYLKAAKTLQNALPDAKKAVKAGESDVTIEQYKASKALLDKSVKVLNKEIKKASSIRSGKTAKNFGYMWAAAATVQFLLDDLVGDPNKKKNPVQTVTNNSPISIPTKTQNPLSINVPSSPIGTYGINKKKLLNFIPVVGPVVNRGTEAKNFIERLTGSSQ